MGLFDDDPLFESLINRRLQDPAAQQYQKRQLSQPLPQADEDTLLSKLLQGGGTALGYAGGVLDKTFGGRAVRQVASGLTGGDFNPRELLSVIPGSDTFGITDESQRKTGEQLAQQWGLIGEGTPGEFELRDLAGPALEALLDPGTYLTFGGSAATKAGKTAKLLGAFPDTMAGRVAGHASIDDVARTMGHSVPGALKVATEAGLDLNDIIGKPLGGVAGLRVPFLTDTLPIGTGAIGQKIADVGSGLYDKALYSAPGRYASAAFDPRVHGALDAGVQRNWRAEAPFERTRGVQAKLNAYGAAEPLLNDPALLGASAGGGPLRGVIEGTNPALDAFSPVQRAAIEESANRTRGWTGTRLADEQAAGLATEPLTSIFGTNYASRAPTPVADAVGVYKGLPKEQEFNQLFSGVGHSMRRDPLFDLPGGTAQVQSLVTNPAIAGKGATLPPDQIAALLQKEFSPNAARLAQLRTVPGAAEALADYEHLAGQMAAEIPKGHVGPVLGAQEIDELIREAQREYLTNRWPAYLRSVDEARVGTAAAPGPGLFGNDVISDTLRSTEASNRAIGRANVAIGTLADSAVVGSGAGTVPITKVLDNLRITHDVGGQRVLDMLAAKGIPAGALAQVHVPIGVAEAVGNLIPKYQAADVVAGPLGLYDKFSQLFKTMTTAPWLAKHTRDYTSSTAQNLLANSPGALGFGQQAAAGLRAAQPVQGLGSKIPEYAARGLNDAAATRELGKEMFAYGAHGRGFNMAREGLDAVAPAADSFAERVPGMLARPSPGDVALDYAKSFIPNKLADLNPLAPLGMAPGSSSKFNPWSATAKGPVAAGREIGDLVDDLTRGGLFADLRRQGYVPGAAAQITEGAHFNYGDLTEFEKNVMRRLMPFYTYARKVTPQQIGQLSREPGGLGGQAIRASNALRQEGGFLPPQLGGGLAIPLGPEDESGNRSYLTKFDLPWEQPFENIAPGSAPKTVMRLLGQLNPLIKGPLEFATGKQFFSGRDQQDLYSRTGIPILDQIIMNTPASRALTTVGTLTDERKDILSKLTNLATGARITDVDVDKARMNASIDAVSDLLRGSGNIRKFENFSVRPESLGSLTPDEIETLRLYRSLEKDVKKKKPAGQLSR